jgi:hypothetical protein
MPGFVYFIEDSKIEKPGKQLLDKGDLERAGLAHLFDGEGPNCNHTTGGPGGKAGLTFSMQGATRTPAQYDKSVQTWTEGPDGVYWIGYTTAERPTPADLVRKRPIAGRTLTLLDGNEWIVPVARSIAGGSTLPTRLVLGPDKKSWRTTELPQFLHLCELADDVFRLYESSPEHPHPAAEYDPSGRIAFRFDFGMRVVLAALATNYKVGAMEVDLLGLLGTDDMSLIMNTLIDLDAYNEMVSAELGKRQASDTAPIDAGSEAPSPDTSPRSPTSK